MRIRLSFMGMIVVLLATAACGSSGSDGSGGAGGAGGGTPAASAASGGGSTTIEVKNFAFTPPNLTVPAGTKVTWKFEDTADHNVVAADKAFSSADLNGGRTYQQTFARAGTYRYICGIHQYMTGTVTVT